AWLAATPGPRPVACYAAVGTAKSGHGTGYRVVLGVVSVPPAYMAQVVRSTQTPLRWWHKAGLLVRSGSPAVTISVPRAWRSRAAITWGGVQGEALRIGGCPPPPTVWHAY